MGKARYLSTKELLLDYTEKDSKPVYSAKRKAELDVWQGWIGAMVNLDCTKRDQVWIQNSQSRFLVATKDCGRQCGHSNFEVVATGRSAVEVNGSVK